MTKSDPKVIYYTDELTDDFGGTATVTQPVDPNYVYYRNNFGHNLNHWFWNRVIAVPIAYLHAKIKFGWRMVNRQAFRQVKKTSYFLYGNHTQPFFDATMPKIIAPKDCYVLVSPANLQLKGLGWLVKKLGALPISDDYHNAKKLVQAIDQIVKDRKPILIYPEAHIWPYYTKIRPFPTTSFRYPVKYNVPAFCFTNTYQKVKRRLKIITYIDGPFYPNRNLPRDAQINDLRDRIYQQMVERSKLSNYEQIVYLKKEQPTHA